MNSPLFGAEENWLEVLQAVQQAAAFINGLPSSQGREGLSLPLAAAGKRGKNVHRATLLVSSLEPAEPLLNAVQKLAQLTGVSSSQLPPTSPTPTSEPAPRAPRGSLASKRKFLIAHYITSDLATAAACLHRAHRRGSFNCGSPAWRPCGPPAPGGYLVALLAGAGARWVQKGRMPARKGEGKPRNRKSIAPMTEGRTQGPKR